MEGLTLNANQQSGLSEARNAPQAKSAYRPTSSSGVATAQTEAAARDTGPATAGVRVEAQGSPFQARLNYDRDKAAVFVEILDPTSGDVIQRLPAESAAERMRELTGGSGGAVVNKVA